MDNEWDEYAPSWDRDPGPRAYADAAFGSLLEVVRTSGLSLDAAEVLDFGCGTGLLTEHLVAAGASVLAVDTSPGMLDALTAKIDQHGWTTVDTAAELPDHPARFDLIVCSSVCGFLDDYPATVAELVVTPRARRPVRPMGLGTHRRRRPRPHPTGDQRHPHRRRARRGGRRHRLHHRGRRPSHGPPRGPGPTTRPRTSGLTAPRATLRRHRHPRRRAERPWRMPMQIPPEADARWTAQTVS